MTYCCDRCLTVTAVRVPCPGDSCPCTADDSHGHGTADEAAAAIRAANEQMRDDI